MCRGGKHALRTASRHQSERADTQGHRGLTPRHSKAKHAGAPAKRGGGRLFARSVGFGRSGLRGVHMCDPSRPSRPPPPLACLVLVSSLKLRKERRRERARGRPLVATSKGHTCVPLTQTGPTQNRPTDRGAFHDTGATHTPACGLRAAPAAWVRVPHVCSDAVRRATMSAATTATTHDSALHDDKRRKVSTGE